MRPHTALKNLITMVFLILSDAPASAATFNITGTATYDEAIPAYAAVFGAGPVEVAIEFDIQPMFGGEDFVDATGTFSWMNGGSHVFTADGWDRDFNLTMDLVRLDFTSLTAPTVADLTVTQLSVTIDLGSPAPPLSPLMPGAEIMTFAAGITGPSFGTGFGSTGWSVDAELNPGPLPDMGSETGIVPLPASGMLLIAGLGGLALMRRRC